MSELGTIKWTRYLFGAQTTHSDPDIPYTINDGVDIYGGSYFVAALEELEAWVTEDCSCIPNPGETTQPTPTPQVFPIPFSSDLIYGRENTNVFRMYRNDLYQRTFVVVQDGQFFDLTNCAVRMTFKWSVVDSDLDAVFVLTNGDGITLSNPTEGEFYFTILPEDTTGLPSHTVSLRFDAQITTSDSAVYTVAYGVLQVLPDVSITTP